MNNCPSCKKVISELKLSRIKGRDTTLPPFDCVTLCCPFCGVILMAVPDLSTVEENGDVPAPATWTQKGTR
jgi:hypothetical protein